MADDAEIMRSGHPLLGMILCCTSVEMGLRNEISKKCEEMGARHVLDLTSDVTHLVCGALYSPKYRYVAKMRPDVKVMSTKWVDAMYAQWIAGEDIDPRTFEVSYRFPVFYRCRISATGIADAEELKRIKEICIAESATYHPDLTKDVTHLIAAAPTGQKYEFARGFNITVVTPEWLFDSLERGMALDEQYYDLKLPRESIGVGAKPAKVAAQIEVTEFRGKREIRKSTQEKLGGQSHTLWNDIIGQAANAKPVKRDEWEDMRNERYSSPLESASGSNPLDQKSIKQKTGGMLANACFWIRGFQDKHMAALKKAIIPHDGTIVDSLEELSAASEFIWRLVMVPRENRIQDCPTIPAGQDIGMVTDWWLESCMFYRKFITPTGDFTTMPIEEFEVEAMKELDICITKFVGIDLLFYPRLIKLLGAKFHGALNKTRSLLITNDSRECESEKIRYAHEYKIPVVTGEWLVECLKQHQRLPYETYLIKPIGAQSILGDRFKRKLDNDDFGASKRQLLDNKSPGGAPSSEGKLPQKKIRFGRGESERTGGDKILQGCTVCISKELKERDGELAKIAEELGAIVLDSFERNTTPKLTHLIHCCAPGKPLNKSNDYKLASAIAGCSIASKDWLYKCRETGTRVDTKPYILADSVIEMEVDVDDPKAEPEVIVIGSSPVDPISQDSTLCPPPPPPQQPQTTTGSLEPELIPVLAANASSRTPTLDRKSSSSSTLSGLSQILGKLSKGKASNKKPGPRGRLQGKASSDKERVFSRPPSEGGMLPPPSQPQEMQMQQPSQALAYNYEETSLERKRVRAKLDKNAVTPAAERQRVPVEKPRGAVDLTPVARRSRRMKSGL
ncbi:hypothetical protein FN846DRAFT_956755 [Sphaerosporella brunnea]|uniref:BRCT domain-containing protein n=1 Tax=Sphaerosporella brunnea TaxID=1250544 RepID=A0A5J5ES54_9PEZI|nr:hypothetical protein FN846DRAFT_956755 [Sphaerosporella brunnea]